MNRKQNDVAQLEFMRPSEAVEFTRTSRSFLYFAEQRGELEALRPSARVTLYRVADLRHLIEGDHPEREAA